MDEVNNWYELGPFTVFDVETTGMSARNNRIVEIAAIHIEKDGTMSRYESLVNPGCLIPDRAMNIHHITNEMVADAPNFRQVGFEFIEFVDSSTLVAHNARFDLSFLQESLVRCGLPQWRGKTMDSSGFLSRLIRACPATACKTSVRLSIFKTRVPACRLTGPPPTSNGRCSSSK